MGPAANNTLAPSPSQLTVALPPGWDEDVAPADRVNLAPLLGQLHRFGTRHRPLTDAEAAAAAAPLLSESGARDFFIVAHRDAGYYQVTMHYTRRVEFTLAHVVQLLSLGGLGLVDPEYVKWGDDEQAGGIQYLTFRLRAVGAGTPLVLPTAREVMLMRLVLPLPTTSGAGGGALPPEGYTVKQLQDGTTLVSAHTNSPRAAKRPRTDAGSSPRRPSKSFAFKQ